LHHLTGEIESVDDGCPALVATANLQLRSVEPPQKTAAHFRV
jgi:hypothetical protein